MTQLLSFLTVTINGAEPVRSDRHTLFAVICIAIGLFNFFCPYAAWYLTRGWQFKGAEPSDIALIIAKLSGVIAAVIGIVFFFV